MRVSKVSLKLILNLKPLLIALQIFLFIVLSWTRFTFSNYQELIVFLPLLILYLNRTRYDALQNEGLNISYDTYELIIFLYLIFSNIGFLIKIYFEYYF